MAEQLPEQIIYTTTNDLRKELETKIDKKIDSKMFYWIIGVFLLILISVFSAAFHLILKNSDNNALLKENLIRLESKFENIKH